MKIHNFDGKTNLVGTNIRKFRISRHLSQEELATKMQLENVEITQKIISRVENHQRIVTDYELFHFAKVLDVDIYELLEIN